MARDERRVRPAFHKTPSGTQRIWSGSARTRRPHRDRVHSYGPLTKFGEAASANSNSFSMRRRTSASILCIGLLLSTGACVPLTPPPNPLKTRVHDVIIRGGTVYDGTGAKGQMTDIAIDGDRITVVGNLSGSRGKQEINALGLAIAPGFINMLSWANESLIQDGRAMSDITQGVTLEVMGEGDSMGPLTDAMKKEAIDQQGDIKYEIPWTTLGEYLDYIVKRGISP